MTKGLFAVAVVVLVAAAVFMGSVCKTRNRPPATPVVVGPDTAIEGDSVEFAVTATDPDGDSVQVRLDWGDGDTSDWSPRLASASPMQLQHAWSVRGNYALRAQARDSVGGTSSWSDGRTVSVGGPDYPYQLLTFIPDVPPCYSVALRPTGDTLYMADPLGEYMAVIDTRKCWKVGNIWIGGRADREKRVVALPDGTRLYVTCHCTDGDRIRAIRTSDRRVTDSIQGFLYANDVAPSVDGRRLYVSGVLRPGCDDGIYIINTAQNTIIDSIFLAGNPFYALAMLAPHGSYLYATGQNRRLYKIRTSDNAVVNIMDGVGSGWAESTGLLVTTPDGRYVFSAIDDRRICVIRAVDDVLLDTIIQPDIRTMHVLSNSKYLYVSGKDDDGFYISVIRVDDLRMVRMLRLTGESGAESITSSPSGDRLYASVADGFLYIYGQ